MGNRKGWVQLLFKLLFLSLPPTHKTWSSSRKESSEYYLLFSLAFATFLLFTEPSGLISSANAPLCAISIIFFPAISIWAILRSCSDVPICWWSYVLSLFGKVFFIKFVLNFKTIAKTLLILLQRDKRVCNVSSISIFTSILLTKTSFVISRPLVPISSTVLCLFHDDSGSKRIFGFSYHILTFAKQVPS